MRNPSHPFNLLLIIVTGVLLSSLTYLYVFEAYAFNDAFYIKHFEALGVQDIVGISTSDLEHVTTELVRYIDTGQGDLHVTATIDGQSTAYFNPKEQAHLNDIKILVRGARAIRNKILGLTGFLFVVCIFINLSSLYKISRIFLASAIASIGTLIVLGMMYLMDFDLAFRKFHEMLFYNDLWLLDPAKDRLLQMMPLEFFMTFTLYCLGSVFFIQAIFLLIFLIFRGPSQRPKRMFR